MSESNAVEPAKEAPELYRALVAVEAEFQKQDFDKKIKHLVKLRASQINQCAFCVNMHLAEARKDGETNERLDRLVVWRHVDSFSPREKAALDWTEALTVLDGRADYSPLREQLKQHFSDREIGILTTLIGMINLWNRLKVSQH